MRHFNQQPLAKDVVLFASGRTRPWLPGDKSVMRRVAILFDFNDTWGRNVLRAVGKHASEADWELLLAPRDSEGRLRVPDSWEGDGVIACLRDRAMLQHVRELDKAAVDIENMFPEEAWLGRVSTNDYSRACLARDHLLSRHLHYFGCYAPEIGRYPKHRAMEFSRAIRDAGYECFEHSETSYDGLARWLVSLPKPVGVFASDPFSARQLVEACHRSQLDIPSDVAVISGDEDELLCGMLIPELSSVELASYRIGVEAASILEQIMASGDIPNEAVTVEPLRVCHRRSTDILAVADQQVAQAVRQIWRDAADGLQVSDIVRAMNISRRTLEQRFKDVLGRTPAEEIRRVKVELARKLLITTSMKVTEIALTCGFSNGPYLARAFRKQYGITPSELRENLKGRGDANSSTNPKPNST